MENKKLEAKQQRTVVLALDGTDATDLVIRWCAEKLFEKDDKIVLAHATEGGGSTYASKQSTELKGIISKAQLTKGKTYLEECLGKLEKAGYKGDTELIVAYPHTSAKAALRLFLERTKPDILVCGSRRLGAMKRALLGSTSTYLFTTPRVQPSSSMLTIKADKIRASEEKPLHRARNATHLYLPVKSKKHAPCATFASTDKVGYGQLASMLCACVW
eukprot:CAMPEP_0167789584 /NCGR_PEP_ID=MMETSP0111_2-20121227/10781_1 /TAXON_ID=91324 /ORGANISM="Lotharella globosa, Strain CCCM811" /LENGTH=216 /DNA_ID=CAMNT_0007681797 /DNA_START=56 /DNA_END=704 /DNA_ORIENTATION=+